MAVQLDPFHMLRAINCPEPSLEIVIVEDAFKVGVYTPRSSDFLVTETLCSGSDKTINLKTHWVYENSIGEYMTSPLYNCAQMEWTAVGQTSGARHKMHGEEKAFLGFDACINDNCWIDTPYGMSRHVVGNIIGDSRLFYSWLEYSTQDLGFTDGELCDIEVPRGPVMTISSIVQRVPTGAIVTTVELHPFTFDQFVLVSGTVQFDGGTRVGGILSTTSFWVTKNVTGVDETSGFVEPGYFEWVP